MKTVLSFFGTILIVSISLSADRPELSYADYEKQLADFQGRDQQLREQIAREQAAILDIKNRIDTSRKNIDDLRRKKLETLGITTEDVDAAIRAFDRFTEEISAVLNKPASNLRIDSARTAGFRERLDSLKSNPACRLRVLAERTQSATSLVLEIEKRLADVTAPPAALPATLPDASVAPAAASSPATIPKTTISTPSMETATYVVRSSGGKPETLFEIAEQVYGNAYLWPRIYQANKKSIDGNFSRFRKSPVRSRIVEPSDLIMPGQVLEIPR